MNDNYIDTIYNPITNNFSSGIVPRNVMKEIINAMNLEITDIHFNQSKTVGFYRFERNDIVLIEFLISNHNHIIKDYFNFLENTNKLLEVIRKYNNFFNKHKIYYECMHKLNDKILDQKIKEWNYSTLN